MRKNTAGGHRHPTSAQIKVECATATIFSVSRCRVETLWLLWSWHKARYSVCFPSIRICLNSSRHLSVLQGSWYRPPVLSLQFGHSWSGLGKGKADNHQVCQSKSCHSNHPGSAHRSSRWWSLSIHIHLKNTQKRHIGNAHAHLLRQCCLSHKQGTENNVFLITSRGCCVSDHHCTYSP